MKIPNSFIAGMLIIFCSLFFKENQAFAQVLQKDSSNAIEKTGGEKPKSNKIIDYMPPARFVTGSLVKWKKSGEWFTGNIVDLNNYKDSCYVKGDKDGYIIKLPYNILYGKNDTVK